MGKNDELILCIFLVVVIFASHNCKTKDQYIHNTILIVVRYQRSQLVAIIDISSPVKLQAVGDVEFQIVLLIGDICEKKLA